MKCISGKLECAQVQLETCLQHLWFGPLNSHCCKKLQIRGLHPRASTDLFDYGDV